MSTINPMIPLGFNPSQAGPDLNKMLSLAALAQKLKLTEQQIQGQNALKQIFADPSNVDQKSGMPTANALNKIMAVDPAAGLELRQDIIKQDTQKLQQQGAATELYAKKRALLVGEGEPAYAAYQDALKKGLGEEQARAAGQKVYTDGIQNLGKSGLFSDQELDSIPAAFDPVKVQSTLLTLKDRMTLERQDAATKRSEAAELERERHDRAVESRMAASASSRDDTGWQVLTDPSKKDEGGDPIQYRYNPRTAEATTLDGKPYSPSGAAKVGAAKTGSGFTPEMGELQAALAEQGVSLPTGMRSREQQISLYRGLLDRNQGKSAQELATMLKTGQIEFGAQKKETQTAAAVAGKVEVAQNEIDEFVPLVRQSAAAVPRGKFVPLTKLMQMADSNISDPDLRALKININSLLNAYDMLASRGGTDVEKRKEVRSLLTSADSPQVLESALKQFQAEAAAAHRAAVKATKVPELEGDVSNKGGAAGKPAAGAGKDQTPVTAEFYVPEPLKGMKGLQWSKSRQQFRDPDSGKVYDMNGKEVPNG